MQPWRGDRLGPVHFRPLLAPPISPSAAGDRRAECSHSGASRAGLAIGGRAAALQAAADRLAARLPKLAVTRREAAYFSVFLDWICCCCCITGGDCATAPGRTAASCSSANRVQT
jgi:hypothetical protein